MPREQRHAKPPLALYVHLPWCVHKCPYCDFNSHTAGANAPKERYISALIRDLEQEVPKAAGRSLLSVFLGGGTPSLFSARQITRILQAVDRHFALDADVEITMEANPGALEYGKLDEYRSAGVTRLSIGAQSFDGVSLQKLGRIHSPQDIVTAYESAVVAGFDNINLDLMFALPGQNVELAATDLQRAIELNPAHVSWYQLTCEPNTVFHSRPPADLPGDDTSWEIQSLGQQMLQEAGYRQYEISAFAKDPYRCQHNLNYWTFGDYLAIGAGAHGKVTAGDGVIRRYVKPAHPLSYIEQVLSGALEARQQVLSAADTGFEYMLNALRLPDGFTESGFEERTGLDFAAVRPTLEAALQRNLMLNESGGHWRPSPLGLQFLNDLQALFLPGD